MAQRLSSSALSSLKSDIEVPVYDRSQLKSGIVHFGPGNFPLAHLSHKTHDLMQSGDVDALNYGIVGVSTQTPDRRDQLVAQDGLYTVVEQDVAARNKIVVIGSVKTVLFAPENPQAVIDQIASPETRIVSMTITPQTHQSLMTAAGDLNLTHPDIVNDLDPTNAPKTVIGYIVRGFVAREQKGLPGITLMNLDNMEHNGEILRNMVRQFAQAYASEIVPALETKITTPNSMVDRIVPKTTPAIIAMVRAATDVEDASAIPAEPMPKIGSWVVEEKFANGRPAWEKLGLVQIVDDVLPYEKMKLRLLNASHAGIANLGDLAGYTYIDEAMSDPAIRLYMTTLMDLETGPTLSPVPGVDLPAYKNELIERFTNPAVKDTTFRVAKDAPLQVVLDSAQDQLDSGRSVDLLALATAAWMRRFNVNKNEQGGNILVAHPIKDILQAKAREGGNDPTAMFSVAAVFGSIGQNPVFAKAVASYMNLLDKVGVADAIKVAVDAAKEHSHSHHQSVHPEPQRTKVPVEIAQRRPKDPSPQ